MIYRIQTETLLADGRRLHEVYVAEGSSEADATEAVLYSMKEILGSARLRVVKVEQIKGGSVRISNRMVPAVEAGAALVDDDGVAHIQRTNQPNKLFAFGVVGLLPASDYLKAYRRVGKYLLDISAEGATECMSPFRSGAELHCDAIQDSDSMALTQYGNEYLHAQLFRGGAPGLGR